MGNMFSKGQVALVRMFSGDDPLRLVCLMLAAYLGISASGLPSSSASCCEAAKGEAYSTLASPDSHEASLTLDAEPLLDRTTLPADWQSPAPRWIF
ncbi:hypothetical protein [Pseudomonas sp. LD120]|uniref:hypothetical protein n=1 Tax=Pseudomonas sp. LD120 TaxID=485751 RepID=UPI0013573DBC|nr:hypothetical protein [Pseudomonas sp. LD120]KAF0861981.1 hypothetical protein PLD_14855 [Pseudomonas sp. LD120]